MPDDLAEINQDRLVAYICAALSFDHLPADPELVERVLTLELEYLQHFGLVERIIDDPRPEGGPPV